VGVAGDKRLHSANDPLRETRGRDSEGWGSDLVGPRSGLSGGDPLSLSGAAERRSEGLSAVSSRPPDPLRTPCRALARPPNPPLSHPRRTPPAAGRSLFYLSPLSLPGAPPHKAKDARMQIAIQPTPFDCLSRLFPQSTGIFLDWRVDAA